MKQDETTREPEPSREATISHKQTFPALDSEIRSWLVLSFTFFFPQTSFGNDYPN